MRLEDKLHHPLQRRNIASDTNLAIFTGDPGRAERQHLDRVLRRGEALECAFAQRVHRHDRNTAPRRLAQWGHHSGAICAGILPDHEDRVRLVEILEQNGAFANADALGQADAGRLMAHVGTVGKVVRAKAPHENLVEECGFIGSAARRVEVRPVGTLERAKMRPNQGEGVVPADGLVVIRHAVVTHRIGQASLLLEPVITLSFQFAYGIGREELGRHSSFREFEGDGFGAILAELKRAGMLRIRPCASRAVKALRLVHRQQRLGALQHNALLAKRFRNGAERAPASSGALIGLEHRTCFWFIHLDACLAGRRQRRLI